MHIPAPTVALILRSLELDACIAFYTALGLSFERECHEGGPVHYAARRGNFLLELYPGSALPHSDQMLAFEVEDLAGSVTRIVSAGFSVVSPNAMQGSMERVILHDPDGRRVMLYQLHVSKGQHA